MKRHIICLMIAVVAIISGCKKAPINEKIEGHWMVKSITTLEDSQTNYPQRLYYSLTRKLIQLEEKQGDLDLPALVGRKEYQDDDSILIISHLVKCEGNGDKDEEPQREEMEPYGIVNAEKTVFEIIKSTKNELVLESDWARIELEKF